MEQKEDYSSHSKQVLFSLFFSLCMKNLLLQAAMHASGPSFDKGGETLDKLAQLLSENKSIIRPTDDEGISNV